MSVTEEGGSNSKDDRRKSLRLSSKKQSKKTTTNKLKTSDADNKRKRDKDELDIDGNGAKGAEGANAAAKKKTKVEGIEEDDAIKKKKAYIRKLSKRLKKAKVEVDGDMIMCYDLDTEGVKKVMGRHNNPKDPFHLTKDALMVISTSREFYKNVHGEAGKRLSQGPTMYENGTAVEGATQIERMVSNLNEYLVNPGNATVGADKAGKSAQGKKNAASGKNNLSVNTGDRAKQEELGGSPAHIFVNLTKHVKTTEHVINGTVITEAKLKKSTQEGNDDSNGRNRSSLVLSKMGLSVKNRKGTTGRTKKVKHNKNATSTLKKYLTDKRFIGMRADPRNRDGRGSNPNDTLPWYNMPTIFYFKGRVSDVAKYQRTLETPSKEEVAKIVEKTKKK